VKVWIEHPAEPSTLILAWQAPDEFRDEDRRRWEVGALNRDAGGISFRYFEEPEFGARNFGRSLEKLRDYGFDGYPAFRFEPGRIFERDVIDTFERRLPPRSRSDFAQYLDYFSIPSTVELSPFQLLGITEARLPGDGFSLIDPLDPKMTNGDVAFEIAGYRHESPHLAPAVGQILTLSPESTNQWDPNAVAVYIAGEKNNGRQGAPRAYGLLRIANRNGCLAAA